jgi:hypothetical protein
MISYHKRYQETAARNGSNSRIWAELTSVGAAIRDEPLYADAKALSRETMLRARDNIAILAERLKRVEYRFAEPQEVWAPPDPALIARLDHWELKYGWLPLSIRTCYEIVGSVNLMGSHPKLNRYCRLDLPDWKPLPILADPLVVDRFAEEPEPFYLNLGDAQSSEDVAGPPYALELAPDAVTKANQSGGGPTEILFPNPAIDAPLISDDWDGVLFVSYLRTCFEWGGFPGWRNQVEYPRTEIEFLTKGLLSL